MKQRVLLDFLHTHPLNNSLLFGFYGGGNYGDELLMEVLAGLLKKQGATSVSIAYQSPALYSKFHHDFGFPRVNMHSKVQLLRCILTKKNLVVGGGGLWGMDANLNIFFMSLLLLASRWLLGKKVYLLAVGFYNSTSRLGRVSAWCAAKAAHTIVARDTETYDNFRRLQPRTLQGSDIAWCIKELDLTPYQADLAELEKQVHVKASGKTLFITLRRFHDDQQSQLTGIVEACLAENTDKNIIVALMEPRHVDPAGFRQLRAWQKNFPGVQVVDGGFNPLALFLFFGKYREQLIFIGPQFHGILSAHLHGVPYFPLAYDNKVHNLLAAIAPGQIPLTMQTVRSSHVQSFIDHRYEGANA